MTELSGTDNTLNVLVTGGAGYIGSHATLLLLQAGHEVTVLDNLVNSSVESLKRVGHLAGREPVFHQIDLRDYQAVENLFLSSSFSAVIHFAGLKAVGESVVSPLDYYHNNIAGSLNLVRAMTLAKVKNIVFSSSATVYGDPKSLPIREDAPLSVTNPYGRTKLITEQILSDVHRADPDWRIALLRYFNPVGAHESGMIGEDPRGIPNNLMPYISQVAIGKRAYLNIFGGDYPTADGTGVRDYIHVMDLVDGHLAALKHLFSMDQGGVLTLNLGTGQGISVLNLVDAFEKASGREVPYRIVGRRSGDVASCYADVRLAENTLGWRATRGHQEMCQDAWRWQLNNPQGFDEDKSECG